MGFSMVFDGLKKGVSKFHAEYAEGRARHAVLAPYPSTTELLAALKMSSPLTLEARDAITLALAAEQQRRTHPLWQSLLLAAYEPMLRRFRGRLGNGKDPENDQRVVLAFLEAVTHLSLEISPDRAAISLRRVTENAVFRTLRRDRREAAHAAFDDDTHSADPHATTAQMLALETNEIGNLFVGEENVEELLRALVATRAGDESLRQYVARTYSELPSGERERTYGRLQQQLLRGMKRLQLPTRRSGRSAAAHAI